jgi:hypothetical protein
MDTLLERRAALEARFSSESSWRDGTADGVPDWFGSLLTDLVLAIGDDEIRYFSVKLTPKDDEGHGSMEVIAFTDELVAYASLDPDPALETRQFEVVVTARSALSSFWVETDPDWTPGSDGMRISVIYPDFSRTLPLGESTRPDRHKDLSALLANLRLDLVASK